MATSDTNSDLDKRVFDVLVRHTVHAFVFDDERVDANDSDASTPQKVIALLPETAAVVMPTLLDNGDKSDDCDDPKARYTRHCQRVLSSQHWTTAQLMLEKRAMRQYLQQHSSTSLMVPSTALYCAFEVYALLKLFLLERACVGEHHDSVERFVLQQQKCEREQFFLILHVQLELFTKYFERSERRKVTQRMK